MSTSTQGRRRPASAPVSDRLKSERRHGWLLAGPAFAVMLW